ncbi:MAG: tRNA 2-thiouridine(34) synthase MnmA [Candidatus Aminicenantes bacterium]|nr:tRNA 2-thiouridine(34) synthase MnmA [Candidatus Aminicenantes bacterium]
MEKKLVAVAMSGGVDSSVAAALLLEKGCRVVGLTMDLDPSSRGRRVGKAFQDRCGSGAVEDARSAAAALGIPHHVCSLGREFEDRVVRYFCVEYAKGRTPNPCVRCNERVKFSLLADKARRLGAVALATGHHARLQRDPDSGRFLLRRGRDPEKDQSYFLYALSQRQLAFARFPVGNLTKAGVRALARRLGLPAAERPESQEICFVPDGDYPRFLKSRLPRAERPGLILDPAGRVIGRHRGIVHFTVGQRRGLGVAFPRPLYVVGLDSKKNTVTAGPNEALYGRAFMVARVNWVSVSGLDGPAQLAVKIRSRHEGARAGVEAVGRLRCRVTFSVPQRAITPGQSAVFYDRDLVVGGGIIEGPVRDVRS